MQISQFNRLKRSALLFASVLLLSACQIESEPKSEFEQIQERGVLRVGTLNNQLSYYIGPDGPAGLDYELARKFAEQLGVKLEIRPAFRQAELFPALKKRRYRYYRNRFKPNLSSGATLPSWACLLLCEPASGVQKRPASSS